MIDLYYWPTPNGKKVTILLEECGTEYTMIPCNIGKGAQFADDFLDISPNNRMPALVDRAPADGGEPIAVFESGAMMMYIAEKEGKFWPQDIRGKYEVNQWVMWQMANQGPKTGERGHFNRLDGSQGDQGKGPVEQRDAAKDDASAVALTALAVAAPLALTPLAQALFDDVGPGRAAGIAPVQIAAPGQVETALVAAPFLPAHSAEPFFSPRCAMSPNPHMGVSLSRWNSFWFGCDRQASHRMASFTF